MQGLWKSNLGKNFYKRDCKRKNVKEKHFLKDKVKQVVSKKTDKFHTEIRGNKFIGSDYEKSHYGRYSDNEMDDFVTYEYEIKYILGLSKKFIKNNCDNCDRAFYNYRPVPDTNPFARHINSNRPCEIPWDSYMATRWQVDWAVKFFNNTSSCSNAVRFKYQYLHRKVRLLEFNKKFYYANKNNNWEPIPESWEVLRKVKYSERVETVSILNDSYNTDTNDSGLGKKFMYGKPVPVHFEKLYLGRYPDRYWSGYVKENYRVERVKSKRLLKKYLRDDLDFDNIAFNTKLPSMWYWS